MTNKRDAAGADVKIRPLSWRTWIFFFVGGGGYFVIGALSGKDSQTWLSLLWLPLGCMFVTRGLALRTLGVDLTPEAAIVRGFRRQTVPWREVQAVVSHVSSNGTSTVLLMLEKAESVTLRYPMSVWGKGDAGYEQDLQRIEQWWLAHRGESWHSALSEEPPPPAY
jgi:hypothetical protein